MCMARDEIGNGVLFAPKRCFVVVDVPGRMSGTSTCIAAANSCFYLCAGSWPASSTIPTLHHRSIQESLLSM
jgi:hypothetical protein